MAQTPGFYYKTGRIVPYTPPSTAVTAGDVVVIGTVPLLAPLDIAVGALGELHVDGEWDLPKDTSTFTAGDAVYWNATGSPVTGTASSGAATSTASGANLVGWCTADAATGVDRVRVLSNAAKRTTTIAGSVTADDITGSDSSLGISGQSAAQGGAVALLGGPSSTSGNAGGAITLVGGTPGVTGIGGAVSMTGAVGGATSGAGGAVNMTGGAGTNGNAAGGAAGQTGGAGQGSAAGGAASMVGGAGGATGEGGAITITSGAGGATSGAAGAVNIACGTTTTSGNGPAVTITSGSGAGGTNSGGNVNLIPGAAVSTGTPGELQVNSTAGMFETGWVQNLAASVPVSAQVNTVFMATRAYRVKGASIICSSTSTVPTVDIKKETGTTAPGSGTTILTGVMTFSATANTRVTGTLVSTVATLTMAAGDRLSVTWGGTVGSITGAVVTISLVPC